jgi:hypothetical protein
MIYWDILMRKKVSIWIAIVAIAIVAIIAAWAISARAYSSFGGRVVAAIHCNIVANLMLCTSDPLTPPFVNLSFSPVAMLPTKFDAYLVSDIIRAQNILVIPKPKFGFGFKSCAGGRVMGTIQPGGTVFYVPVLHVWVYLFPSKFGAACKGAGV